ncbi:MAG: beta-galactosidase [Lentisphaeria bacterium]|nr:beta-galactosidase [Lentisphaeria bacterium]
MKKLIILALCSILTALFGEEKLFNASRDEVRVWTFDNNTKINVANNKIDMTLVKNGTGYQGVRILPLKTKFFDLSKGSVLSFKVENKSNIFTHVRVEIFNLNKQGTDVGKGVYSMIALKPYETAIFRTRYGRIASLGFEPQGMQHNFDGFSKGRFNIVTDRVAEIRVWTTPVDAERRIILSDFKLLEPPKPLNSALLSKDTFYPFIDKYGQYKHADWKNKIHSDVDLQKKKLEEDKALAAYPCVKDRTRFGGWKSGPTFKTNGWGKVKYKGKWFFVDPEGKLFWSLGVNTIDYDNNEATGIAFRENYFEELPAADSPLAVAYTHRNGPRYGFYKGKGENLKQFTFYWANLIRKYGENYHTEFVKRSQKRLSSWGFNTNGNWVHPDILNEEFHHPYISAVKFAKFYNVIEGCKQIGWQKFPDIFDPNFEKGIRDALQGWQKNTTQDEYCIGYFIDNELSWGKTDTFLAEGAIRSTAKQPAKQAMTEYYKKKYTKIEELNKVWGSSYKSWEDFLNTAAAPVDAAKAKVDLEEFNQVIVETYFKVCKNAINTYAPGKLYFGCRFNDWNVKVIKTAARYVDGVSFNRYASQVAQFALPDGADCPVIIGEWHYGTTNNGPAHGGLQFAADQKDRARAIDRYVRSALVNPQIVGVHYFKYSDQPTTGRTPDDENIQCGLVDIADTPYIEVIEAFRKVSEDMYLYRSKSK